MDEATAPREERARRDADRLEPGVCGHRAYFVSTAVDCGRGDGHAEMTHRALVRGGAARSPLGSGDHVPVEIVVEWQDARPPAVFGDLRHLIAEGAQEGASRG